MNDRCKAETKRLRGRRDVRKKPKMYFIQIGFQDMDYSNLAEDGSCGGLL
jgi:hypothetical protein